MRCVSYLVFVLFLVSQVFAAPIYGYDILGLAKQDIEIIKRRIAPNSAIGVLAGSFGDTIPALEKLLMTSKVIAWRMHLGNGSCQRARNCQLSEPTYINYAKLTHRVKRAGKLALKYPSSQCYLSPYLEHDVRNRTILNRWFAIIAKKAPHCIPVCSAFRGKCPANVIIEKHGEARGDIVSTDGVSLFDLNPIKFRKSGSVLVLGWIPECNLRVAEEKKFIPIPKRTNKLTVIHLKQMTRLLFIDKTHGKIYHK